MRCFLLAEILCRIPAALAPTGKQLFAAGASIFAVTVMTSPGDTVHGETGAYVVRRWGMPWRRIFE
jgi:hypothetical protein